MTKSTGNPGATNIKNDGTTDSVLTLAGLTANWSFAGVIADGTTNKTSLVVNNATAFSQTLTGTNTYTGDTTVTAGTLLIDGNQSAATGAVSVASAGTLGGNGTVGGNTTVSGTLSPGSGGIGGLTFGGTLALNAASVSNFEVDADTTTIRDRVLGVSALTYGGKLKITATGTLNVGDSWDLFEFTSQSGTFDNDSSFDTDGSSDPDLPDLGAGLVWQFDYATGVLSVANSSTPFGTWALLKGLDGTPGKEDGKADDPDKDGKNNLQEFAFNGNPLDPSDNGMIAGLVQDASAPSGDELTLIVAVRNGATFSGTGSPTVQSATVAGDGVTYSIEGSVDLATIPGSNVSHVAGPLNTAPAGSGLTEDLISADWKYHVFKLDASEGLPDKGFLRAKVSE